MRLLSARPSRLLVLDPNRQYTDLAVEIGSLDELDEYLGRTRAGRFRIAYANDRLELDAPALFSFAYANADKRHGPLTLGIEEASMFCDPYRIAPELKKIADYGRHQHVSFLIHSRRPSQEIHHVFTSQAWELFCFRTTEPADVEWIAKFAGKEFAKRLEGLPPLRCLWRNLYDGSEPPQEIAPPLAKAA